MPTEIDKANRDNVVGTSDLNDINVSAGLKTDTKFNSATARLGWDFGAVDLVSITNYQDFDKHQIQDCDSSPGRLPASRTTRPRSSSSARKCGCRARSASCCGMPASTISTWKTRVRRALSGDIAAVPVRSDGQLVIDSTSTTFDTTTTSWAAFGQLEYRITDDVALIGGLRYTDNKTEMTQVFLKTVPEDALGFTGGVPYPKETLKKDNVSYTAKVTWDVERRHHALRRHRQLVQGRHVQLGLRPGPRDPSTRSNPKT